jgi:hypothetical protein
MRTSGVRTLVLGAAFVASWVCTVGLAQAETVTIGFAGKITSADNTGGSLPAGLEPADPNGVEVAGSFTFQSDAVDSFPQADEGRYPYDEAVIRWRNPDDSFGEIVFAGPGNTIVVRNNVSQGDVYGISGTEQGATATMTLLLKDSTQGVLSDDSLPLIPPDNGLFDGQTFRIADGADSVDGTIIPDGRLTRTIQPLLGKSLLVKDKFLDETKRRVILVAKDLLVPALVTTAADPTLSGGSLDVFSPSTTQHRTFDLPYFNWKGLGRNPVGSKGYKYFDKELDDGPCKVIIVKPSPKPGREGLVRAVCLGKQPNAFGGGFTGLTYDLSDPNQQVVGLRLSVGGTDVCVEFGPGEPEVIKDFGVNLKPTGVGLFKGKGSDAPSGCTTP